MEIVVDTNVFVNGIFSRGMNHTDQACKTIVTAAMQSGTIQPIGNPLVYGEYLWVLLSRLEQLMGRLKRDEFRHVYLAATRQLIERVKVVPRITEVPPHWIDDNEDPDKTDKMFLETATDAGVRIIVSDDHSIKNFIKFNTAMGHQDALHFVQKHSLEFFDPVSFVKNYLSD